MADPERSPRRARTWAQRLLLAVGCLTVLVSAIGAAGVAYFGYQYSQIDRVEDLELDEVAAGEPKNYLIVGTDSREGLDPDLPGFSDDGQSGCDCTDTIIVLRVDPDETSAAMLSFPRDLRVEIAGTGTVARINSAHQHGEQVLIDTIEQGFGIPIHHYVEVDFVGFERLVNAVGGIPLWFDAPVRDDHTGLNVPTPGCAVLDGDQARKFVRSRYLEYQDENGRWRTDPTADLGRITRQQAFIRRSVSKAVSKGLTNPVTLNSLVTAGVQNVRLDDRLDAGDLLALGRRFASFDAESLVGYSVPTQPYTTSRGYGGEVMIEREAEPILNLFRGLPPGTLSPKVVDVTVLNGTGIEGQAADVAGALARIGFTIQEVASYEHGPLQRTTVFFGEGGYEAARRVALHLTGGADLVQDEVVPAGQVVLVTGADFTTVHDQMAPEGSADDLRSTTTTTAPAVPEIDDETGVVTTPGGDEGTSTTVAQEPTGYATGEPPPGVDCG